MIALGLLFPLLAACDDSSETKPRPRRPKPSAAFLAACRGTLTRSTSGTIASAEINESSGLVAGGENGKALWFNNDSGDSARVFAVSTTGALLGTYPLDGATALDWEDIAIGPGPIFDTPHLYVGDIGDNAEARSNIVVYRVAEPSVVGDGGTYPLAGVEALTLEYPDGPHDAEALIVDPESGQLYIVVKHLLGGPAEIYRAPSGLAAGSTTVLEPIGQLKLPLGLLNAVTAADISRDGSTVAVRTYGGVRLWNLGDQPLITALRKKPCRGPIPIESQGETIGFAPDGRSYFTVSEGSNVPIHRFAAPKRSR